jgi:hypothetical protein
MPNKNCKKCNSIFNIDELDENFFKKFEVPVPNLCPECRMQKLMAFRNERNLFKRKCDFSGKEILAIYPPDSKYKVYDNKIWWSDKWDALDYEQDFDFDQPFFKQYEKLNYAVPRMNIDLRNNENSDYCNDSNDLRNCYLCFNAAEAQDSYYCNTYVYSRDCMDTFWCVACELCYECIKLMKSYHCFWCFNSFNLSDCYFCEECMGCKNCFGCVGLRQKQYCVYNKQLTKDKYEEFIKSFDFSYENIQLTKEKLSQIRLEVPHKNLEILQSEDCTGDYISNSKNCVDCFDALDSENCRYVQDVMLDNSYDCFNCGGDELQGHAAFIYNSLAIYYSTNIKFSNKLSKCSDLIYCDGCFNCDSCFGCVGLKYKKYCILNKQYTKEEYQKLLPRIIEHMKNEGEYGEFFSANLSPTGYNYSLASYYYPLSKEQAIEGGFLWSDYKNPPIDKKYVEGRDLPSNIQGVDENILNDAIKCESDGKLFKIIPAEFNFYKKHNIPLPHLCPDCRHYRRKDRVNPRKLWDRRCNKCSIDIKTTYSEDRSEKIYCEKCYLGEVY